MAGSAPQSLRYSAALNVRVPVFKVNCFVSRLIPASIIFASLALSISSGRHFCGLSVMIYYNNICTPGHKLGRFNQSHVVYVDYNQKHI